MEKKRGGDREAAGDDFIPNMTTFLLLGWDRGAAEVALTFLTVLRQVRLSLFLGFYL
jgi:hypothetical protein